MSAPSTYDPAAPLPGRPGVSIATGLTVADLDDRPEWHQDGLRVELIHGELFVSPAPIRRHQDVLKRLVAAFLEHEHDHGGALYFAPTGVLLTDDTMVQPDALFLGPDAAARLRDPRFVDVVPDLVVEVSSPTTRRLDLINKRGLYEATGVPEYWFVDLEEGVIDVHRLDGGGPYGEPIVLGPDDHLGCLAAPGLTLAVRDVLALG